MLTEPTDTITREPIAVVGIGCRFAHAPTPEALWANLIAGVDPISEVPAERFDVAARFDPRPAVPGRYATRWGSFIDNVNAFDHAYFGMSPREASRMDPQQRVLLEVAAETLDDACLSDSARSDLRTGVYVGCCTSDWEVRTLNDVDNLDLYACTGVTRCTLSGRISFAFDLRGPSMTVDAGCSSSLLAIHLACQALHAGELTLALAGGVNMILDPGWTIGFSQAQMLSPDGRCKTFDSRANGFVRADGCGMVALMKLSQAQAIGARIYATIRGSGVSNDGASNGLLATPSAIGQVNALRAAYKDAGLSPHDVQYIEAHGTGTPAGDPVEIAAISSVMQGRAQPCLIGSIKSNIGHAEGAAGVAGFIKTCLAVQQRALPKSMHFEQPNPNIVWDGSVKVVDTLQPWPEGLARAGISSFGISGTDVHIVIEEVSQAAPPASKHDAATALPLLLSSTSQEGLAATAAAYAAYLCEPTTGTTSVFNAVCRTAAVGRNHQLFRLGVAASDAAGAAAALRAYQDNTATKGLVHARAREHTAGPVLVFSGQGSQWAGMGKELLAREPMFRRAVEACDQALRPYTDARIVGLLEAADDPALQSIDVIQPSLFAIQVGLAALWKSMGLSPSLVIGHSMGEIAAAHFAGIISLDDAARIVCSRSQLLKRTSGRGGMLAVELPIEQARAEIARFAGRVGIAVSNSPSSTVLSGEPSLLRQLESEFLERTVYCRFIAADVAGHSPQLDPLLPELAAALASVQPLSSDVAAPAMFSTVTGSLLEPRNFDASYWVRNLRQPVLFSSAMQTLIAEGYETFVEVSPHPILGGPIRQLLEQAGRTGSVHASLIRDESAVISMRSTLAALHCEGHAIDLGALFAEPAAFVSLPPYVWQREPLNVDMRASERSARAGGSDFSLLGPAIESAAHAGTHIFQSALSLARLPYLGDHRVRDVALVPGAAYLDMALSAAHQLFGVLQVELHDVTFDKALQLPAASDVRLQLVATQLESDTQLQYFTQLEPGEKWTPVAKMRTSPRAGAHERPASDLTLLRAGLEPWPVERHYQAAQQHGIEYGPAFQGVRELWLGDDAAFARCSLPGNVPTDTRQLAHAALLDACMQTLAALVLREGQSQQTGEACDAWLPVGIKSLRLARALDNDVWVYARRHEREPGDDRLSGDLVIYDSRGHLLMEVDGFTGQRVASQAPETELDSWLHELRWQPSAPALTANSSCLEAGQTWLVLAHGRERVGARIAQALSEAGVRSVLVYAAESFACIEPDVFTLDPSQSEHFTQLLQTLATPPSGVVHLWSLGSARGESLTTKQLDDAAQLSCLSVAYLVQALQQQPEPNPNPKLWIVTSGAQKVLDTDVVQAQQAPVWALARVLRYEHTELATRCVDLGASSGDAELSALLGHIVASNGDDQLALRGHDSYVARLVSGVEQLTRATLRELSNPAPGSVISALAEAAQPAADSSYLITGGLGGLGLVTAEWLAKQGAKQLILLGRAAPSEQATQRIEQLRAAGVCVWIRSCDVAERESLRALLDEISAQALPLRGVVHSAGVLDDGLVSRLTAASLERVMRPKLHGAYNLHLLTRALPLHFFVLYSSGAAMLGSPGQGNYAAANAFMDALAEQRRTQGLPALSVAWGPWRESGLAVRPDRAGRLHERGLGSMSDEQGMRVLERLLRLRAITTAVFPSTNWRRWAEFYPVATKLPMFDTLLSELGPYSSDQQGSLLQRIEAAEPAARAQHVETFLLEQMRRVLKTAREKALDPELALTRHGVDSLMALELKNRIGAELSVQLPVSKILLAPSARQLALDIVQTLAQSAVEVEAEPAETDQVRAMSDAQVDVMLRELLADSAEH